MGYRSDLTGLINLLDSGGFTAEQGLALTADVDDARAQRVAQRREEQQGLMGVLGDMAMAGATGGASQDDVLRQMAATQQFSGQELGPKNDARLMSGLSALFAGPGARSSLAPAQDTGLTKGTGMEIQTMASDAFAPDKNWGRAQGREYIRDQVDPDSNWEGRKLEQFNRLVDIAFGVPDQPPEQYMPEGSAGGGFPNPLAALANLIPNWR